MDWPWITSKKCNENNIYMDYYLFVYGYEYKLALKDYISIAGKIPIPPKFAFGYWYSRYWAFTDIELKEIYQEHI